MKYTNLHMCTHFHDTLFSLLSFSGSGCDMWPTFFFKVQSDFLQHVHIFTKRSKDLATYSQQIQVKLPKMSKKKWLIDTKVKELGQVVTAWICGLLFHRATDRVVKVVHSLPCIPHVSPRPVTGLTYIQRAGWDGAMQTARKPDQLAAGGLRAHQKLCLRQTGVSMCCLTSWMFTCYSDFTTKSRQDLLKFCTKSKKGSYRYIKFASAFLSFLLEDWAG